MSGIRTPKPGEKLIIVCPDDITKDELQIIENALCTSTSNFPPGTERRFDFYIVPKGGTVELKYKL